MNEILAKTANINCDDSDTDSVNSEDLCNSFAPLVLFIRYLYEKPIKIHIVCLYFSIMLEYVDEVVDILYLRFILSNRHGGIIGDGAIFVFVASLVIPHAMNLYYWLTRKVHRNWFRPNNWRDEVSVMSPNSSRISDMLWQVIILPIAIMNLDLYNNCNRFFYFQNACETETSHAVQSYLKITNPLNIIFGDQFIEIRIQAIDLYKHANISTRLCLVDSLDHEIQYVTATVLIYVLGERIPQIIVIGVLGGWFSDTIVTVKFIFSLLGVCFSFWSIFSLRSHYNTIDLFTDVQDPNGIDHVSSWNDVLFRRRMPKSIRPGQNNQMQSTENSGSDIEFQSNPITNNDTL